MKEGPGKAKRGFPLDPESTILKTSQASLRPTHYSPRFSPQHPGGRKVVSANKEPEERDPYLHQRLRETPALRSGLPRRPGDPCAHTARPPATQGAKGHVRKWSHNSHSKGRILSPARRTLQISRIPAALTVTSRTPDSFRLTAIAASSLHPRPGWNPRRTGTGGVAGRGGQSHCRSAPRKAVSAWCCLQGATGMWRRKGPRL